MRGARIPPLRPIAGSRKIDDLDVWSVWCIRVRPERRGKGLSHALLPGAVEFARSSGAPAIEGYPVDNRSGDTESFQVNREAQQRLQGADDGEGDVMAAPPEPPAHHRDEGSGYQGQKEKAGDMVAVVHGRSSRFIRGKEMAEQPDPEQEATEPDPVAVRGSFDSDRMLHGRRTSSSGFRRACRRGCNRIFGRNVHDVSAGPTTGSGMPGCYAVVCCRLSLFS